MLVDSLKELLATQQALALKVSGFHWNVEDRDFLVAHPYLGELYSQLSEPVDKIAEYIRILGQRAPAGFARYIELSKVTDADSNILGARVQYQIIYDDLTVLTTLLNEVFVLASQENKQAIMNSVASWLDTWEKEQWKLRSTLK